MKENLYNMHLDNFDGPIDLLLTLVKEKKMDILNINLLDLANEYIKIIENLKNNDINLAVEYLVIATYLLKLKTYTLLANPESDQFVKNEKTNILKKMIELQKFKNTAKILRIKELDRKNIFVRQQSLSDQFEYNSNNTILYGHSNSLNIVINLKKMFERKHTQTFKNLKIEKFKFSPAERRLQLLELFKSKNNITFEDIFTVPTINHFVVTVITILDMAKKQELILEQKDQFATIFFRKGIINGL